MMNAIQSSAPRQTKHQKMQSIVRKHLRVLQQLERERDAILSQFSQYLSSERAKQVKQVIATMPYNPLKYE